MEELSENKEVKARPVSSYKYVSRVNELAVTGGRKKRKDHSRWQICRRYCILFWHETSRSVQTEAYLLSLAID